MKRFWSCSKRGWILSFLLGVASVLACPMVCEADMGVTVILTAFEQARFAHLSIGNFILGVIEASILASAFGTPTKRTAALMIAANYVSAAAYFPISSVLGIPFAADHLLSALLIAFALTIVIEAPFVCWCFPKSNRQTRRWLTANVLAQILSYALLTGFYLGYSSLLSDIEIWIPTSTYNGN